jgi:hypothetical protein
MNILKMKKIFFVLFNLICQIDDVQQQTSNVNHTLQANASNGKCPISSTVTANGITRQATRQSVNASDVKK